MEGGAGEIGVVGEAGVDHRIGAGRAVDAGAARQQELEERHQDSGRGGMNETFGQERAAQRAEVQVAAPIAEAMDDEAITKAVTEYFFACPFIFVQP